MLSVLPREMEESRASQSRMLDREENLETKRKPRSTVTSSEGLLRRLGLRGMLRRRLRKILSAILRRGCER